MSKKIEEINNFYLNGLLLLSRILTIDELLKEAEVNPKRRKKEYVTGTLAFYDSVPKQGGAKGELEATIALCKHQGLNPYAEFDIARRLLKEDDYDLPDERLDRIRSAIAQENVPRFRYFDLYNSSGLRLKTDSEGEYSFFEIDTLRLAGFRFQSETGYFNSEQRRFLTELLGDPLLLGKILLEENEESVRIYVHSEMSVLTEPKNIEKVCPTTFNLHDSLSRRYSIHLDESYISAAYQIRGITKEQTVKA